MNLKNKKVLITGATGGIGNCLIEKFSNLESIIIATGTNEEKLNNLKKKFPNIQIEKFKLDEHDKIEGFIENTEKKLNGLDVLVNNAGITLDNLSIRLTDENWKRVLDINLTSTFLMCKHAIKKMLKRKYGKIINITSIVGHTGNLGQANYAASKAGLIHFTKASALELGSKNIRVNSICPGLTDRQNLNNNWPEGVKNWLQNVPLQRLGTGEDIANAALFLVSDAASFITGANLIVDGGMECVPGW